MNDDAAAGGDGSSWASAFRYLQDGLAAAHAGDDSWVAEGTYKPDQGKGKTSGDRTASFALEGAVDLYGGFLGSETSRQPLGDHNQTILSGEIANDSAGWSYHVVSTSGPSVISGFRITKGNANGSHSYGGGMYNKNSSPTLTNYATGTWSKLGE